MITKFPLSLVLRERGRKVCEIFSDQLALEGFLGKYLDNIHYFIASNQACIETFNASTLAGK